MEYRALGNTDLRVSALGFGCGAIGGLMVRGDQPTRVRGVERAVAAGITYFDTAQMYGDGASETHLGQVLAELKPDVVIGSKVMLKGADFEHLEAAVAAAAELSLQRLQLERLDLFYIHNTLSLEQDPDSNRLGIADLEAAARAFERLQTEGKIRHWGFNGLGDTKALHQAINQYPAHAIQSCCNLLNPSTAQPVAANFPFQNYGQLARRAAANGKGVVAFRIMAGGALSGHTTRHPVAAQSVAPIATSADLATDVAHAKHFEFLIAEDWVEDLPEAAIRFALSQPDITSALIGLSDLDQLERAIAAAEKGPLPQEALDRLPEVWASLSV